MLQLVSFSNSTPNAAVRWASTSTAAPLPSASLKNPSPVIGRYKREKPIDRDLPIIQSRTPLYLAIVALSVVSWGGFLFYATNNERSNSTVVRSLQFQLKASPAVTEFLGDNVRLVPLVGEFRRVDGSINMLAGKIDVRFRVTGSKAKGTANFTSVRKGKEGRFQVLRWKITRDDGEVLDLATQADPTIEA
ncbi:cytochrome c oxidase assembly factor 1, partial [Phenoliferia sp. Uapishka_3]